MFSQLETNRAKSMRLKKQKFKADAVKHSLNRMLNARKTLDFEERAPDPLTYFVEATHSIREKSQREFLASHTRSNEFAPFNSKSDRFAERRAHMKATLPGPASYFAQGNLSSFT